MSVRTSFPCGRWLGKGIDDDSTERLLVGEREKDGDRPSRAGGEGSRIRSPSVPPPKKVLPLSDIQHMLGRVTFFPKLQLLVSQLDYS